MGKSIHVLPGLLLCTVLLLAIAAVLAVDTDEVCAVPPPGPQPALAPSAVSGQYCGGDPLVDREHTPALSLDLNAECKALYGAIASAVTIKPDAYGWVCRVSGKPDAGLNMQALCSRQYGGDAIATLVGIGANDWRCLRPADVSGHVVSVLLFPVEKLNMNEAAFVTASLQRIQALMGGIRRFYRERTSAAVRGTNAFVLLTNTSSQDWQNLAKASMQDAHRFDYHTKVKQELVNGRWNALSGHSSVRIGGFPSLGSMPPETPDWHGAASDPGGQYFSGAPSNSYGACSPSTNNSSVYENAFYGTGHEFGHTMGLQHTDQYPYNELLLKPQNWNQSIMYQGNGTNSLLFPFEAAKLLPFLTNWR